MPYRVDRQGLLEAAAVSSAGAGGVPIEQTSEQQPPWQPRPFTSRAEYAVTESMRLMAIPAEQIRKVRPPMLIDPFPPIYGYDTTPLTIDEVLDTERWSPTQRAFMSGSVKPRHADVQEDMWSSTPRNIGGSPGVM